MKRLGLALFAMFTVLGIWGNKAFAINPADFLDVSLRVPVVGTVLLPARLYVPTTNNVPMQNRPLVIWVNGGATTGTDNLLQITWNTDQLFWACRDRGAYLLAPQFGPATNNSDDLYCVRVMLLVDQLVTQYGIDTTRIYVTGFSLGGRVTQRFATVYANQIAAAVPISAPNAIGVDYNVLGSKPMWIFHARDDAVVYVGYSRQLYNHCLDAEGVPQVQTWPSAAEPDRTYARPGSNHKYTETQDGNHWIWGDVYYDTTVMNWLFSQVLQGRACDPLDFNHDSMVSPEDVDAYFRVLGEGPCPTDWCNDLDFNNDQMVSPLDIDSYFSVLGEGPCL